MIFFCKKCKKERNTKELKQPLMGGGELTYGICPVCKNVIKQKDDKE